eukprot:8918455-Pyramimonas_sp.AAC.1
MVVLFVSLALSILLILLVLPTLPLPSVPCRSPLRGTGLRRMACRCLPLRALGAVGSSFAA